MTTSFSRSRRDFLRNAACSSFALSTGGALMTQFGLLNSALAQGCSYAPVGDYKALVCLFLLGGNDSWNMLIPSDSTRYAAYSTARSGGPPAGMAIAQNTLVPVNVLGAGSGETYGLHPNLTELASVFNAGNAAFVVNVGTALQPINKSQYLTPGYPVPPQLFSHADQQAQWQYGQPKQNGVTGWGGLLADRLHVLNPGMTVPMSLSLSGQNRFQVGDSIQPYTLTASGPVGLNGYTGTGGAGRLSALEQMLAQTYADPFSRTYAKTVNNSLGYYQTMQTALAAAPALTTPFPANNPIAAALQQIAKIISVRDKLGAKRQIFFIGYGSFDSHDNQLTEQPKLFTTISQALAAFNNCTINDLKIPQSVTTFTLSEFARTLNSNGDGTDHAWAGMQFVMGGAVKGQRIYGAPAASGSVFPNQALNGPDCLARGQMMPGVSCDQYSATLASWLGVQSCDIAEIFPYVKNFPTADLGFLS
ncbi:MAG: DUF1501 domain-containing protein [Rudaea sp.]|uniref:DUF1501 domain-containing protein n=1 Tax=unclassified Rudaea TaxID=2627037 RepID=UPI0010F9C0CA|nr:MULTISPECIES: DUF1501 domain-containing protein [unclassified Rudaea]MBN8887808.1 DUF1501 domain-containing protein [Rudaea sp.]MBR0346189.1 DUF1501 domain-containing protein [Rudaea sp.]